MTETNRVSGQNKAEAPQVVFGCMIQSFEEHLYDKRTWRQSIAHKLSCVLQPSYLQAVINLAQSEGNGNQEPSSLLMEIFQESDYPERLAIIESFWQSHQYWLRSQEIKQQIQSILPNVEPTYS